MKPEQAVFFHHILDAITWIEKYLTDCDEELFKKDHLIQDGVIRQLEIIGEAIKNLPDDIRSQYPDIPWKDFAGMRDKLIHHYFGIDVDTIWLTTQDDLPPLKETVETIVESL